MKKNILLAIFFLCSATILKAQTRSSFFALRAGYLYSITSIAQVPGSLLPKPDIDNKAGLYAGISYTKKLSNLLIGRTEINYQNKGVIEHGIYNGLGETKTYNFNYIGLTPLFGLSLAKNINFFLGPEINFLLKDVVYNNKKSQSIELGLTARSSYQFHNLIIDLGYFKGVTPYSKSSENPSTFKYFNQNWQIGVGYLF